MVEREMQELLWRYPERFLNEPLKQFAWETSSDVGRADLDNSTGISASQSILSDWRWSVSNATQYARSTALWLTPRCAATSSLDSLTMPHITSTKRQRTSSRAGRTSDSSMRSSRSSGESGDRFS